MDRRLGTTFSSRLSFYGRKRSCTRYHTVNCNNDVPFSMRQYKCVFRVGSVFQRAIVVHVDRVMCICTILHPSTPTTILSSFWPCGIPMSNVDVLLLSNAFKVYRCVCVRLDPAKNVSWSRSRVKGVLLELQKRITAPIFFLGLPEALLDTHGRFLFCVHRVFVPSESCKSWQRV